MSDESDYIEAEIESILRTIDMIQNLLKQDALSD